MPFLPLLPHRYSANEVIKVSDLNIVTERIRVEETLFLDEPMLLGSESVMDRADSLSSSAHFVTWTKPSVDRDCTYN